MLVFEERGNRSTRKKTSRNQRQTESILQCSQLLLGLTAEVVFPQDLVSGLFLADRLHDDHLEREEPKIFQLHNKQLTRAEQGKRTVQPTSGHGKSMKLKGRTGETEKKGNECMGTVTNINNTYVKIPPFSLLTTLYLINK